jgi:glycosyltransferase involved in cell wall biosynthesis
MSARMLDFANAARNRPQAKSAAALVSVVIPTHNRAKLLERALRSVLAQTYPHLEIIVVDDGSSDATSDVVRRIDDRRLVYLRHEQPLGGSAARNTGIDAASGKYIAFLDDDDEWEPQKTERQLALLARYDAVLCMYSMGGVVFDAGAHGEIVELDELRRGFIRGGSASALMARAEVLKHTMFDTALPKCQDWDLCIRIAQKHRLACVNEPLVRYNDGAHDRISNRVARLPAPELARQLQMLDKHHEFFGKRWYRRHLCQFLLYGIGQRPDRYAHVRYAIARCGFTSVARVLLVRCREKMVSGFKGIKERFA